MSLDTLYWIYYLHRTQNVRHIVKELLERGDSVGTDVVELSHQFVGALLREH